MRTAWWHRVKTPSLGPEAGCPRYASDTMLEPLTGEGKTEGTCGEKNRRLLMEIYQEQFPSVSDPKSLGHVPDMYLGAGARPILSRSAFDETQPTTNIEDHCQL